MSLLTGLFLAAIALGTLFGLGALFGEASDAELEVDTDIEADGELPDGDAAGDSEADTTAADGAAAWWSVLGVGRVPLGLLASIDLLIFGASGLIAGELLDAFLPSAATVMALPIALVLGTLGGARLAGLVARHLPSVETYGTTPNGLLGRFGRAELAVNAEFGRARVRDDGGALHFVRCRTAGERIAPGESLLVTDRDPKTGLYLVVPKDALLAEWSERDRPRRREARGTRARRTQS